MDARPRLAPTIPTLFLSTLLAACGGSSSGSGSNADAGDAGGDVVGEAPTAAAAAWTWIDVPSSACDDGTPTGIAVNPAAGADLVIYLEGGGACWDYTTCFILNTTAHGPVGRAQWATLANEVNVGPFDRTRASNPFRDASYVFVPYCTGDMHGGDRVATYTAGSSSKTMRHVGRKNLEAALAIVTSMWRSPARVVIAGTSAGGFGANFNAELVHGAYPGAKVAVVDDAGPLLEGDGIPATIRAAAYASWNLGEIVDPLCPGCRDDFSGLTTALAVKYPSDRFALVSALDDPTVEVFFSLDPAHFKTDLLSTIARRYAPTSNARAYLVAATQHGYLPMEATTTSGGVTLDAWLGAMLDTMLDTTTGADGGVWDSVSP